MPGTLTGRLNGRDRDRDQPSAQGKKNSGKIPVHFVGARGARARFTDGVREHHRRRTHPGASTDNAGTRTRGRVGVRVRGFARAHPPATAPRTARARYALRAERGARSNGAARVPMVRSTHTHIHTHTGTGVCGIGSIICRFLESKMRYRWQRLHRLFYRFLE